MISNKLYIYEINALVILINNSVLILSRYLTYYSYSIYLKIIVSYYYRSYLIYIITRLRKIAAKIVISDLSTLFNLNNN